MVAVAAACTYLVSMNRIAALVSLACVVAGCAGGDPSPSRVASGVRQPVAAEAPPLEWSSSFRGGSVEIVLSDPRNFYRIQQVRLVDPAGNGYPAPELTRTVVRDRAAEWSGRPSLGIGGAAGSHWSSFGIGLTIPLGQTSRREEAASYTATAAWIPVPDPDYYSRTAQSWTLELTLLDPSGGERFARIPAPVP